MLVGSVEKEKKSREGRTEEGGENYYTRISSFSARRTPPERSAKEEPPGAKGPVGLLDYYNPTSWNRAPCRRKEKKKVSKGSLVKSESELA